MSRRQSKRREPGRRLSRLIGLGLIGLACRQPIRTDSHTQPSNAAGSPAAASGQGSTSASTAASGNTGQSSTAAAQIASGKPAQSAVSSPPGAAPVALNTELECAADGPTALCTPDSLGGAPSTVAALPSDAVDGADDDDAADEPRAPVPEPTPKQRKPKFAQTYVVAFMGDSLTDYRSGGGRFITVLEKHCPQSQFDNYGIGGQMTNQMRRRFKRDVFGPKKPPYTHVVVFGGVNDLYSDLTAHRSNEKIQSDLSQMYSMAREGGLGVIALTVSPWGGFARYFNKTRAKHTRELNAWIVGQRGKLVDDVLETSPILSCGNPERLCQELQGGFKDGLHFGTPGHDKLGEALFQQVFHDCR